MFVVLGSRQKGKTEHLIQELVRVSKTHESVRYIVRSAGPGEVRDRVANNPFIRGEVVMDYNVSVSIPIVPHNGDYITDYLVVDHVEKTDPVGLQKLLMLFRSVERELGVKVMLAVQLGFDHEYFKNVIGNYLTNDDNDRYVWLN